LNADSPDGETLSNTVSPYRQLRPQTTLIKASAECADTSASACPCCGSRPFTDRCFKSYLWPVTKPATSVCYQVGHFHGASEATDQPGHRYTPARGQPAGQPPQRPAVEGQRCRHGLQAGVLYGLGWRQHRARGRAKGRRRCVQAIVTSFPVVSIRSVARPRSGWITWLHVPQQENTASIRMFDNRNLPCQ
jgi:hypothetical protein